MAVPLALAGPGGAALAAATPNVDASYGTAGIATVAGDPSGTAVDAAGRAFLITTDALGDTSLNRLTAGGARDTSFGTGGAVALPYGGLLNVNTDGSASVVTAGGDQRGLLVHRVSGTGATLASTSVLADRTVETVAGVTGRADGVLIVHGIDRSTSPAAHLLAAVRPDGTLATTWGAGGVVTVRESVHSVAASGTTVAVLTDAGVRRYTAAGIEDSAPAAALPTGFQPYAITAAGGAYLVSGSAAGRMAVVRVLATGASDTGFGSAGMAVGAAHDCTPTGRRSFATAAGVYLIGHGDCGASQVYVQRFTAAGIADGTFGNGGEVVVDQVGAQRSLGGSGGGAQPDGKVVVTFESANNTASAVRLLPSAVVPAPYVPVPTTRVLPATQLGPQKSVTVTIRGTGVAAVALDVAVARGRAAGGVLVHPTGGRVPAAPTNVHVAGQAVTQRLVVPLGSGGRITLRNASGGSAHLAANLVGWYRAGSYVPVTPARILNARGLRGGKTLTFNVAGRVGVPATGVREVLVNVSVNGVTRAGSLKLFPAGARTPAAVVATHAARQPGNATVRVTLGTSGRLTVLNNAAASGNVTVDVVGYLKS
ncbi:hypothetical protein [Actinoplanes sp. URMC 104]|uniref:hypothetical protein n=1 Tax=Actinoplanes sp. URMC 104 TaxID=3423409 RepID=UPI003F1CA9F2